MPSLRILLFAVCTLTTGALLACADDSRGDDPAAREGLLAQQQQTDGGARDRDVDTDEDVDEGTDEANDVDTDSDEDCDSDSDGDERADEANDVDTDSDSDERCGAPAAPGAPGLAQSVSP